MKCNNCGGELFRKDNNTYQCRHCLSEKAAYNWNDETNVMLDKALQLRLANGYDLAYSIYQDIIHRNPDCVDAYWGALLSKYGVEISERTKFRPSLHKISENSFTAEKIYNDLLSNKYVDGIASVEYKKMADEIEFVRCEAIKAARSQQKYDIFLSFKNKAGDEDDSPLTPDRAVAERLYNQLIKRGYHVFFAPVTLKGKAGLVYEPIIYAALHSADTMVLIASKKEYAESSWVANEWKRFTEIIVANKRSLENKELRLFVCHSGELNVKNLPSGLERYQTVNLDGKDGEKELLSNFEKKKPEKTVKEKPGKDVKSGNKKAEKKALIALLIAVPIIFLSIFLPVFLLGKNNVMSGLNYNLIQNGTAYEVSKGSAGNNKTIVIPSAYNGKPVTAIAENGFDGCVQMIKITIPESVTAIEAWAFNGCESLSKIELSKNVAAIKPFALSGCSALENIVVNAGNESYKSIDGNLYDANGEILIQYSVGKAVVDYGVSSNVLKIGNGAFYNNRLVNITMQEGVVNIGEKAFMNSESLESITIPATIADIGNQAFSNCTKLLQINLTQSVNTMGNGVFENCSLLNIYTEATSKPVNWQNEWNRTNCPVTWGGIVRIVFNINGGNTATENLLVQILFKGENAKLPEEILRTGYSFSNWLPALNLTEVQFTATYTAQWMANTYAVNLDTREGALGYETENITYDGIFSIGRPDRRGYDFLGWYYLDGVEIQLTNENGNGLEAWKIPKVCTVYAKWDAQKYTIQAINKYAVYVVSFNLNGGDGTAPVAQTVTATTGLVYPAAPTRGGYIFLSWHDNPEGTGTPFDFSKSVSKNITLYAKWYNNSYGVNSIVLNQSKSYSIGGNLGSNYFTRLYFVSSATQSVSVSISISNWFDTIRVDSGYSNADNPFTQSGSVYKGTSGSFNMNVTGGQIYSICLVNGSAYSSSGTILISGNDYSTAGGKSNLADEFAVTYDQIFTIPPKQRAGYNFIGWFSEEDGTGIQYTNGNGQSVDKFNDIENIELYAYYLPV